MLEHAGQSPGDRGMTVQLMWDEAVGRVKSRLSPQNYEMWLRPIEVRTFSGSVLRLRAPNSYVRTWFESNFLRTVLEELRELGHEEIRVEWDADGERELPLGPPVALDVAASNPAIQVAELAAAPAEPPRQERVTAPA